MGLFMFSCGFVVGIVVREVFYAYQGDLFIKEFYTPKTMSLAPSPPSEDCLLDYYRVNQR